MFHSAQLVLDVFGRPIFVLPVNLPKEGCHLKVSDTALDFMIEKECIGHIDALDPAIIALISMQKTVGIIVYPENSTDPCPDYLTHTATVEAR